MVQELLQFPCQALGPGTESGWWRHNFKFFVKVANLEDYPWGKFQVLKLFFRKVIKL